MVYFQRSIFDEQARHYGSVLFNTQTDAEKLQSWSNYVGNIGGLYTDLHSILGFAEGVPPKKNVTYRFPKWWILYGEDTTKKHLKQTQVYHGRMSNVKFQQLRTAASARRRVVPGHT